MESLFGCSIEEIIDKQRKEFSSTTEIPFIVEQLIEYLKHNGIEIIFSHLMREGLNAVGIFRIASDKAKVRELKADFEKAFKDNKKVEESKLSDVHATAAVLKLYLYLVYLTMPYFAIYYLPKSLLVGNDDMYDVWLDTMSTQLHHFLHLH